jgi:hypothetical protein
LIELFEPDHGLDYYILKPFHSGFFCTGLEVLLRRLAARKRTTPMRSEMSRLLKADVKPSHDLQLEGLLDSAPKEMTHHVEPQSLAARQPAL